MHRKTPILAIAGFALAGTPLLAQQNQESPLSSGASYELLARHSKKFLDAKNGLTANTTPLIQWNQTGGANQKWRIDSLGNNQYRLVGLASGKAVDIKQSGTAANTPAILYDWLGGNNQRFTLQYRGQGYYSLVFVHSGKALGVAANSTSAGASVVQLSNDGATATQWRFLKGPAGYFYVGDEYSTAVKFTGKADLAYGANGKFHFVNNADGNWTAENETFGDPISGVAKALYYKWPISGGPGDYYTYCADEGETFHFTQPVYVAYGANGKFVYKTFGANSTVSFNNATFGDPAVGSQKKGWFKTIAPTVPSPSTGLSDYNLYRFINNHTDYNGTGPAYAYAADIRLFLEKMGGDHFINRFLNGWNGKLYILPFTGDAVGAVARAGGGRVEYDLSIWNANPTNERVGVLIHEFTHLCFRGNITKAFFDEMSADKSKEWHSYAATSRAEFIADGTRWIIGVQGLAARQTIFDRQPSFYLYMVNVHVPYFFKGNWKKLEDD